MNLRIRKAAVIGSGVMGSGIAAHLANVGIPSLLLDIVPKELTDSEKMQGLTLGDKEVRNRLASSAKKKLLKQKPAPLMSKEDLALIEAGNLEDDIDRLKEVDWIIEVVVENLDVKRSVFKKIEAVRKPHCIVSSNTSGISIREMSEGLTEEFQQYFLGTHFFNPPRYLKLLEVIPTEKTSTEVVNFVKDFGQNVLGKGIVEAKDTPNFIGNRIGVYGLLITVKEMLAAGLSVGEVDSITGPLIGRPKSATFRTLDVVGLDTLIHVATNIQAKIEGDEKAAFEVPLFMKKMNDNGWIGGKAGQGFYHKQGKEIFELDPESLEYHPRKKLKTTSTEMSKQEKSLQGKIKTLLYGDDKASSFLWKVTKSTLLYTANLTYQIADDISAIDKAMKWGFGWEFGPFEMWDAIGVQKSVERMRQEGEAIPSWIDDMLSAGFTSFYLAEKGTISYYHDRTYVKEYESKKSLNLPVYKENNHVLKRNSGASLIDIGDDILLLEFHSQNNSIGLDIIQMINYTVDEAEKNYKGIVIGNKGKNFCVGANIALILMEAQDDNYFEIDMVVRQFQKAMMRLKYSAVPVVAAPFAMTLGGGAEVCLPAAAIQASAETYMGLVEVGVGLIPGGGGNKEFYLREIERLPKDVSYDLQKAANHAFETIAMAKVSTSAEEARERGFLRIQDGITFNQDHLLYEAKQQALALANAGYVPSARKSIPVVGETGFATMLMGAKTMHWSGYISEHDLKIAEKLAFVLAGGRLPFGTKVDEQYLLDLEREAFLSLVGEPKTQARMQHMLLKGKPLRN